MAKQLQLRRGTTAQHSTFTGAAGEVTLDTDKDVVVVHDGTTAGGFPSQKELISGTNIKTINNSTILGSGNMELVSAGMITGGTTNQVLAKNSSTDYDTKWYSVQEPLISGTNIKTVNSTSLLGSGDVAVQPTLVSGTNIKSINSSSILASGNLDLVAKVSSTDNAIVRFDGTSGAVQNSSAVIDNSGNVGIGVTPSAWRNTTDKTLQINGTSLTGYGNYATDLANNAFLDSTSTYKYIASSIVPNVFNLLNNGGFAWKTAPSGTAGSAITWTNAMTLNASGDLTVPHTYSNTTASAANMYIDSAGKFYRSTSSRKYKTNIEDVEKQYVDLFFNNARPIYYKSLSENDNPNWGYWGFIAEEIAEFDPRLVHWRYSLTKQELVSEAVEEVAEEKTIDAVLDDEGNEIEAARVETVIVTPAQEAQYKEVPDTDSPLEAEGVMYERIVVMLTAKIQELEARIEALEAK